MVTSTPASPDGSEPNAPAPRYERLSSIKEQVAAIDTLIDLAKLSIRVFDVDMSRMGWNGAARIDKLLKFLRGAPAARIEIVLHDTDFIASSCPRLTNLFRVNSHVMTIRKTGEDARARDGPADDRRRRPLPSPLSTSRSRGPPCRSATRTRQCRSSPGSTRSARARSPD
jgi:hypothetical protein